MGYAPRLGCHYMRAHVDVKFAQMDEDIRSRGSPFLWEVESPRSLSSLSSPSHPVAHLSMAIDVDNAPPSCPCSHLCCEFGATPRDATCNQDTLACAPADHPSDWHLADDMPPQWLQFGALDDVSPIMPPISSSMSSTYNTMGHSRTFGMSINLKCIPMLPIDMPFCKRVTMCMM